MTSAEIMIDVTHSSVDNVPTNAPKIAGYVTGTSGIEWTPADWARFPNSGHVRIDQSASLSQWATGADVADVETGAASITTAVDVAKVREAKGWYSFIYISQANLAAVEEAVSKAGLKKVQYWVANWNLSEAEATAQLGGDIVAIQWASPTSNPETILPGTDKTLAAANVDLSVTIPSWFAFVPPTPKVVNGLVVDEELNTYVVKSTDKKAWKVG